MTDMHFVYGFANGNAKETIRIYQERYSIGVVSDSQNTS